MKVRNTQKLVCPYCKAKQEYRAKDYLPSEKSISLNIQCDNCDQLFNAKEEDGMVESYSNLTYYPIKEA